MKRYSSSTTSTLTIGGDASIPALKCFKLSAEKEAAGLALPLSSDCKSIKLDKPIFVRKGGSIGANGSKTKPYATIQAACGAMNNASLDYTILVDGLEYGIRVVSGGKVICPNKNVVSIHDNKTSRTNGSNGQVYIAKDCYWATSESNLAQSQLPQNTSWATFSQ